jgi:hypothetical protein
MDGLALHVAWAHIYLSIPFSLDKANAPWSSSSVSGEPFVKCDWIFPSRTALPSVVIEFSS